MMFKILFFLFLINYVQIQNPFLVVEESHIQNPNVDYKIVIPSISLDSKICLSKEGDCFANNVWLKYFDKRGNMLFTGHSFTVLPFGGGVFYSLKDMEIGDRVYVSVHRNLVFRIDEIFVVDMYDLEIENFENLENTIILYTCYPLWSASKRIVLKGSLCEICEYEI